MVLLGSWLMVVGCAVTKKQAPESQLSQAMSWKVFQGAWFQIDYPADFTPMPSLPSSSADGYDSAEFISADGQVSFYVFAPQWGGEPTDIAFDSQREILVSEKSEEQNGRQINWSTMCEKDGSYCRDIYTTTAQQETVRTTFGIKYRGQAVRHRYHEDYLKFQHSLQQFAD